MEVQTENPLSVCIRAMILLFIFHKCILKIMVVNGDVGGVEGGGKRGYVCVCAVKGKFLLLFGISNSFIK